MEPHTSWYDALDERQRKEVALACAYRDHFAHGTDGHHRLLLIAKLADLLSRSAPAAPTDQPHDSPSTV